MAAELKLGEESSIDSSDYYSSTSSSAAPTRKGQPKRKNKAKAKAARKKVKKQTKKSKGGKSRRSTKGDDQVLRYQAWRAVPEAWFQTTGLHDEW